MKVKTTTSATRGILRFWTSVENCRPRAPEPAAQGTLGRQFPTSVQNLNIPLVAEYTNISWCRSVLSLFTTLIVPVFDRYRSSLQVHMLFALCFFKICVCTSHSMLLIFGNLAMKASRVSDFSVKKAWTKIQERVANRDNTDLNQENIVRDS